MSPFHRLFTRLAVSAALCLPGLAAAQLYKWVDEKGVTNYSNNPSPTRPSTMVDERNSRLSQIEAYDYGRGAPDSRVRGLQDRVARLEEELERDRAAAAAQEAAAQGAYVQWREQCIAQRRTDCDGPPAEGFDPGYGVAFPPGSSGVQSKRPAPGSYRPTSRTAVGAGGVVGPYYRPPRGDVAVGAGPYGIGAGFVPAAPGGVVVGPGPGGAGAALYPVPEPRPAPRLKGRQCPPGSRC